LLGGVVEGHHWLTQQQLVATVEVCPRHRRALVQTCPNPTCGRLAPWLSPRARPGRCGWCGQWLGAPLAETVNSEHTATSGGLGFEEQCICTALVGELLAAPPELGVTVLSKRVCDVVNFAAERLCAGNRAALGRLLGVPKNTAWEWRADVARPQLALLLRLALLLNVSLRHLLLSPGPLELEMAAHIDLGEQLVGCTSPENGRHAATRAWEPVQQALSHEVAMGSSLPGGAISMRKVATRLGVPVRSLYRRSQSLPVRSRRRTVLIAIRDVMCVYSVAAVR
jgi:hypothetical protein